MTLNVRDWYNGLPGHLRRRLVNDVSRRNLSGVHFAINYRDVEWTYVTTPSRGGKVGYITEGMDCDGMQYHSEGIVDVPAGAFVHQRAQEKHEYWLDGPERTYYVNPERFEPKQYQSRDRALEAFENGHAHSVTWGNLEEV